MSSGSKNPRSFKFEAATTVQLEHLCTALGSTATAVLQHAVAAYYRDLFGQAALLRFTLPPPPPSDPTTALALEPAQTTRKVLEPS